MKNEYYVTGTGKKVCTSDMSEDELRKVVNHLIRKARKDAAPKVCSWRK